MTTLYRIKMLENAHAPVSNSQKNIRQFGCEWARYQMCWRYCEDSRMTEERERLKRDPINEDAIASMCPCHPKPSLTNYAAGDNLSHHPQVYNYDNLCYNVICQTNKQKEIK